VRHPGVVLIPPKGRRAAWRARYADPDSNRTVWESLDRTLTTADLREDWAIRKAKALGKRRVELEEGAPRATGATLQTLMDRYFKDHPQLAARTKDVYQRASRKLVAWGKSAGAELAEDLNRARLLAFRAALIAEPRRRVVAGGKRGEKVDSETERRAPAAINIEIRSTRTILGYLCDADLLPRCSHDDLRRALKRLPVVLERPDFLESAELQRLLEAALRHDAETFAATREEHAGRGEAGSTPRHETIAPFVAFMVLTGMRVGHALALDWSDVSEHRIAPRGGSSTKRPGVVDLDVTPSLAALLAALRPKDAKTGRVFSKLSRGATDTARDRLSREYDAPAFSWQKLRRTAGCFLTNAPGIFAGASAYRSAKWLGHSVQVAERHYVDVIRGIPADAKTLEAAMGISGEMARVVATREACEKVDVA
jgi:integrase